MRTPGKSGMSTDVIVIFVINKVNCNMVLLKRYYEGRNTQYEREPPGRLTGS